MILEVRDIVIPEIFTHYYAAMHNAVKLRAYQRLPPMNTDKRYDGFYFGFHRW